MKNDHDTAMIFKDEVYAIIGATFEVYNTLGSGFLEGVYQEALATELSLRDIPFEEQKQITVIYKDRPLRTAYYADFLCFSKILLEIKAQEFLTTTNEAQLLNYMHATKLPMGVLINFGNPMKLEWKRFVL